MTNRRKFILQGSFAATAFLFTKPFKAIAGMSSPFIEGSSNFSQITFLHTSHNSGQIASQVNKLVGRDKNIVLLHAGKEQPAANSSIQFDATAVDLKEKWDDAYTIIDKNGVRTGVIALPDAETEVFNRVNSIAAHLKNVKDCKLVIFMSTLGYKNKNKKDDINLAARSEHIDIIISKYNKKLPSQTHIACNKKNNEVIIQHHNSTNASLGKIQLQFNQEGHRHEVSFN